MDEVFCFCPRYPQKLEPNFDVEQFCAEAMATFELNKGRPKRSMHFDGTSAKALDILLEATNKKPRLSVPFLVHQIACTSCNVRMFKTAS